MTGLRGRDSVYGMHGADLILPLPAGDAGDEFGRLVGLVKSNDELVVALRAVSGRLRRVRAYLARPACNVGLGRAYYQYWRARHSGVLTLLRANRIEARRLLARLDPEAPGAGRLASLP